MKGRTFCFFITIVLILSLFTGCAEYEPVGTLYLSSPVDGNISLLEGLPESELDGGTYQDPNAEQRKTITWRDHVWELEYDCSSKMNKADFDIDVYKVVGGKEHQNVTFRKDTGELVRAFRLSADIPITELTEQEYYDIVDSLIETFTDMSLDSMQRQDVTTYAVQSYEIEENGERTHRYAAGKKKYEFYKPKETITEELEEKEIVQYYTTAFAEILPNDFISLRHLVVELDKNGGFLIEVYDIDTSHIRAFAEKGDGVIKKDFTAVAKAHVKEKELTYESVYMDQIKLFSKGGKVYAEFMAGIKYKEGSQDKEAIGEYVIEYKNG